MKSSQYLFHDRSDNIETRFMRALGSEQQVHILMGLCNGANYLSEQLESISRQTHTNWRLTCSDDGSVDQTCDVVRRFARDVEQRVDLVSGPAMGFSENFLSMVRNLPRECGLIAFADQDDIWLPDKLRRGLQHLSPLPRDKPAIYGSASWLWNSTKDTKKPSLQLRRPPSFLNALVENFATGNTMVLNEPAARLLCTASKEIDPVFAHDWWAYALISGSGGNVIHDDTPTILYRQHRENEIGAGETFLKRQLRNLSVADGRYRLKVGQNLEALTKVDRFLTPKSRSQLSDFMAARDTKLAPLRLLRMMSSGVYRQSRRDMIGLLGAATLGKV